jgi:hypothetical protein
VLVIVFIVTIALSDTKCFSAHKGSATQTPKRIIKPPELRKYLTKNLLIHLTTCNNPIYLFK